MDMEVTGPDSADSGYVALDEANAPEVEAQSAEQTAAEELYELITGKNADGTPIKKNLSREEAMKLMQKGFGADKEFEEAKATKKQMTELARMLADPKQVFEVLKHFKHDPDLLMTGRMAEQMLQSLKTPEDIEREGWKKDAEEYRAMKSKQMRDDEDAQVNTRAAEIRDGLYSRIEETLNTAGVKNTKGTVAQVARYVQKLHNKAIAEDRDFDINTIKLENIVAHLRDDYKGTVSALIDDSDEDSVLSHFTDAQLKKLGAALTKKLSGGNVVDINTIERKATNTPAAVNTEKKERVLSTDEANDIAAKRTADLQRRWIQENKR